MNETKRYFAAVVDDVVYGVGETEREAVADAIYWYGKQDSPVPQFDLLPCTKSAFDELFENGWSRLIAVNDTGVSLKMELV
jgi:hypothetical protein